VQPTRPKNLNLLTIHFPIPAIVSILHRVSGFALFLFIPLLLWLLDYSLNPMGFEVIKSQLNHFSVQVVVWLLLIPLFFHLIAGIRHLLMDIHLGDALKAGRITAWLTFIVTGILILLAGIWLW
jgi:succinate dehydrogenase / fumarate reductase cytochrome b subunit